LLPVKVYDVVPLHNQDIRGKNVYFLIVLIIRKKDKRCPIIKVNKKVFEEIALSDDDITIYDYIHTETFAEKTIENDEWIWKCR
jgi:hypothetical protein